MHKAKKLRKALAGRGLVTAPGVYDMISARIADAMKAQGFEVDRRKILLPDPLKTLGETMVPVKLHRDVTVQVKVTVAKDA